MVDRFEWHRRLRRACSRVRCELAAGTAGDGATVLAVGSASLEEAAEANASGARPCDGDTARWPQAERAGDRASGAASVRGTQEALGAGEGEEEHGEKEGSGG